MMAVFLDRDGTVIKDETGGIGELELAEGAVESIKKLNEKFKVIIVTNQPGIAKGFYTEKDVEKTNDMIKNKLVMHGAIIDAIYYCPHHSEQREDIPEWAQKYRIDCNCRKPKTGMLEQAAKDFQLSLRECWIVGDQTRDIGAGKNAGCKTILLKTGFGGSDSMVDVKPDFIADNLLEASDIILKNAKKESHITQAVILAGGRGERLRPLTDTLPKPMLPIAGRPLLEWQLLSLKKHGITNVVICASYLSDKIKGHFGDQWNDINVIYPEEKEPLGTGGALKNAEAWLDDNFLLINGDVANLMDFSPLIDFHIRNNALVTVVARETDHPKDSDILDVDNNSRVVRFLGRGQEDKKLANTGLFVINRCLLEKIPRGFSILEKDIIAKNLNDRIFAFVSNDYIRDVGTFERYEKINKEFPIKAKENGLV